MRARGPGAALALGLALAMPTAAAHADDNAPPVLGSLWLDPTSLGPEGGQVDAWLTVDDPDGTVTAVTATAYSVYGNVVSATLGPDGGHTWAGAFIIPVLASSDSDDWTVEVTAVDDDLASTTQALGSISQAAATPFDQIPDAEAAVSPQNLPADGGSVDITATATDDRSVSEVGATVTDDHGAEWVVSLDPVSADGYAGSWDAPPNATTDPHVYTITVIATDDIGQQRFVNAGQVTVAGTDPPPDDLPPAIVSATVDPRHLSSEGGVVDVSVQASDDVGIGGAKITLVSPEGEPRQVTLSSIGRETYGTQVQLASNGSTTDQTWSLGVTVTDTNGASVTASLGHVTVAAPPPLVTVSRPSLRLVAARPGARVERSVRVSNAAGTRLLVRLRGLTRPFRTSVGRFIRLAPGQTRVVEIVFRAAEPGRYVDRLEIVRRDGRQPRLGVRLVGRVPDRGA